MSSETPSSAFTGVELDGRYRVGSRLVGAGGDPQIELYDGVQLSLERKVMIKLLRLDKGDAAELEARFRREAVLLSRLDHPNIVHVVDFGVYEGCPYIVREFVDGRSLGQLLYAGKIYTPDDAVPVLVQLCEALEHAHQAGVIHRDLSPSKIILSSDGRARITDFGIARLLGRGLEPDASGASTSLGEVIAAPEYASPEVLLGQGVDRRSDLYSLGAIAYRMVAHRAPYPGLTPAEVLTARARGKLAPLEEAAALTPASARFAAVVDRLLHDDKEQRCSSASWVAHALRVSVKDIGIFAGDGGATLLSEGLPAALADTVESPKEAVVVDAADDLPDESAEAVLVADPNYTLPGAPPPISPPIPKVTTSSSKRPHAQLDLPVERGSNPELWAKNELARVWDALGDEDPDDPSEAQTRAVDDETAVRHDSMAGIDVDAAKPAVVVYYEHACAKVAPALERAAYKLELGKRARIVAQHGYDLRVRLGIPPLSVVQKALIGAAAVTLLAGVVYAASGPEALPEVVVPTNAELAAEGRTLARSGRAAAAIEQIERTLVIDQKYGDPALHGALGNAYVLAGEGARAVQHYAIAVRKDPSVLDDGDVAALVGLLGLPKGDGERVVELVRLLGSRAAEPLRLVAEDKKADRTARKRARELLRVQSSATAVN